MSQHANTSSGVQTNTNRAAVVALARDWQNCGVERMPVIEHRPLIGFMVIECLGCTTIGIRTVRWTIGSGGLRESRRRPFNALRPYRPE